MYKAYQRDLSLSLLYNLDRSLLIINIQEFFFYFGCFGTQLLLSEPSLFINIPVLLVHGVVVVNAVRVVGVHGEGPRRLCEQSLREAD